MPDNDITKNEESTEEAPVTEPENSGVEEKTAREKIYEKYYGSQADSPVVSTEGAKEEESSAPQEESVIDRDQEMSAKEAPEASEGSTGPRSEEEIARKLAEVEALIKAQQEEIARFKAAASSNEPEAPQPVEEQKQESWVELYREGKFEEGDRALARRIDELNAQKRASEAQAIMAQTVEMLEAKHRMQKFTDEIKRENPHLKNLEGVFNSAIERDIIRAKEEGKIRSHKDFADFYVERLKAYVDSANNVVKESRASGAKDATVRTQEVISEGVMKPQEVSSPRVPEKEEEKKQEVPEDPLEAYIFLRRQQAAKRDGLAT